jgi:hypothetical protein
MGHPRLKSNSVEGRSCRYQTTIEVSKKYFAANHFTKLCNQIDSEWYISHS